MKLDRNAWAIILLAGAGVTYTGLAGWIVYLLAYEPLTPAARIHHLATLAYELLALSAIPTVSYAVGSWLKNLKLKGSKQGLEIDAEGD
jgi:branched-subunit amino acid ABC-type transport system permease component